MGTDRAVPRSLFPAVFVLTSVAAPWLVGSVRAAGGEVGLFLPRLAPADRLPETPVLGVVRSRDVRVDLRLLPGSDGRSDLPAPGHHLLLNLFDDVALQARLVRAEATPRGMLWVGKLEGDPLGDVVLVAENGLVEASISSRAGFYTVRSRAPGIQFVEEIEAGGLLREDSCVKVPPAPPPGAARDARTPVADDGSTFDVLVVYTPAAAAGAGSVDALKARINLAVAQTNTAYANSGVQARVRLVGAEQVAYTESGSIDTDLNRVSWNLDGYMDEVHALRNSVGADLVSLIVSGGGCGVAWLGGGMPWDDGSAFSVVAQGCLGGLVFAHELGHTMGLNHARSDPGLGFGAFPYSYGYKDPANLFRTVMAYDCPGGCPWILYFSNPNVGYGGRPTGVDPFAPDSADSALSINNARVNIANWRAAIPRLRVVYPNGGESLPAGSLQAIGWTASGLGAGLYSTNVRVTFSDGTTTTTIAEVPRPQTSYLWTIPSGLTASGTITVCSLIVGSCEATDRSDATFSIVPAVPPLPASGDLNGDGRPDVLWRHQTTGELVVWYMNGATKASGAALSPGRAGLSWAVGGTPDLNGDGKPDILWQHQVTGDLVAWTMNGATMTSGAALSPGRVDPSWAVAGVGDFNGDGRPDILFRHRTAGDLVVWYMNGSTKAGGAALSPGRVGLSWAVTGVADFSGDGKPDILWRNTTSGDVVLWLMNGTTMTGGAATNPSRVDPAWSIGAVSDFSGDGKPDIVWRHQVTGDLVIWTMNGVTRTSAAALSPSRADPSRVPVAPR